MTRLLSGIAICGVLASLNAHAATPKSFLGSLKVGPTVTASHSDADDCANFNGTWSGTCSSPDGSTNVTETFTVTQQGCTFIEVSASNQKMGIPIGGVMSIGGAMPADPTAATFGINLNSHWNKGKKVLSLYAMGGAKRLAIDDAGEGFAVKEDVQLINDTKMAVDMFAVGGGKGKIAFCQFDKQP